MITFILSFSPVIIFMFLLQQIFRGKDGLSPPWMQKAGNMVFRFAWRVHDYVMRPIFGSGEVTKTD
jgi:hypothetical protein